MLLRDSRPWVLQVLGLHDEQIRLNNNSIMEVEEGYKSDKHLESSMTRDQFCHAIVSGEATFEDFMSVPDWEHSDGGELSYSDLKSWGIERTDRS